MSGRPMRWWPGWAWVERLVQLVPAMPAPVDVTAVAMARAAELERTGVRLEHEPSDDPYRA
jgi:hypothetical protein